MSTEKVTSWMERRNKLIEGYSLEKIWHMDKTSCFLKALPDKGLVQKRKQAKGGKKFKQQLAVVFSFVHAAREKVDQSTVIWKGKLPCYFKKFQDPSRPANVHYFSNPKSCLTSEVMEAVLANFSRNAALKGTRN